MAEYNKKWADLFPATIGNQNRPAAGVDNTLPYETDKFPQHIANDPVRYDKMNAVVSQAMSNDERLNEKINKTNGDLAAHNKDPKAHATGISGNAATATKLQTARALSLTGKASGSTTFDGSANASINVTSVNADTASKLSTARKINITGNASGSATFDGTSDININTTVNESKHAVNADVAKTLQLVEGDGTKKPITFNWLGKDGQPQWLWGNNDDDLNTYVYNPSNFHVAAANNDGDGANIANTYLKKSGGNMSGPLNFANFTWNLVGDDSYMGDHNVSGTFCVKGANGETGIALFKQGSDSDYARISYNGGNINFNKKIAANLAGNADTATHASSADSAADVTNATVSPGASNINGFAVPASGTIDSLSAVTGSNDLTSTNKLRSYIGSVYNGDWYNVISIRHRNGETDGNNFGLLIYSGLTDTSSIRYRKQLYITQWTEERTLLDSENYNNYAPTKTGGGASGTWGISISGKANTAGTADIANKGSWIEKRDDRWYQMGFSLMSEFDWDADNTFQYNPASKTLKVSNVTGNAATATTAANLSGFLNTTKLGPQNCNNVVTNGHSYYTSNGPALSLGASTDDGGLYSQFWGDEWGGQIAQDYRNGNIYTRGKNNGTWTAWRKVHYADDTATNADKLDGYHASDLLRTLGGNRTPVITDIFDRAGTIDMSTMSAGDKARHKAAINKSSNMTQNIWNNSTGIHAYGGDLDIAGYHRGALKLTQSYKNFDKILVVGTNDDGNEVIPRLYDVWKLTYLFSHSYRFLLFNDTGAYWELYGSVRTGTDTNYSLSTDTIWNTQDQNAGIIAIYGIKY